MRLLWDDLTVERTVKRITHEIIERHGSLDDLVLFGIAKKGVRLAEMIGENLHRFERIEVPVYPLDVSAYRDDDLKAEASPKAKVDVTGKHVVIVDDVLYTGRTTRAAMDAVVDGGRPATIQLAVLIDRGHRELPIRADYVGKNVPTRFNETIVVNDKGVFIATIEEDRDESH